MVAKTGTDATSAADGATLVKTTLGPLVVVAPASLVAGQAGTVLVLSGSIANARCVIWLDGKSLDTRYDTATARLSAPLRATDLLEARSLAVQLFDTGDLSVSAAATIVVAAAAPPPADPQPWFA